MRKRLRINLVILIATLIGAICWWTLRPPPEPVYDGKPISYWINRSGRPPVAGGTFGFSTAYPKLDSNAVPFLLSAMQRKDGRLEDAYITLWKRSPLWVRKRLPQPTQAVYSRISASLGLANLGKDAKPAIPVLVRALKEDADFHMREFAAMTLWAIDAEDKDVRAALLDARNDKHLRVRQAATNYLTTVPPKAKPVRQPVSRPFPEHTWGIVDQ